jgi:uncharacterized protein YneF (UPF0154 family)
MHTLKVTMVILLAIVVSILLLLTIGFIIEQEKKENLIKELKHVEGISKQELVK